MKNLAYALMLFAVLPVQAATRLTMGEYLSQVEAQSPSVQAARLNAEGGERRMDSASVLTFPYVFGALNSYNDKSETAYPATQGTGTNGYYYTAGLGVNSAIGLNAKYSWNTTYANTSGISFANAGKYTSYNKLDFTLNLIRNGFGSEIRARQEVIRAGNEATSLAGKYQFVGRLSEAESTYWRLAFARQSVEVQKDVLERAQKLLAWAKRRVGLQLGDKGDLLQAQATHDLRVLELASAVEEEKISARAFNLLRNTPGESVPEAVAMPSIDETLRMPTPQKEGERLDLQAAAARTRMTQAQIQVDKDSLKPNVDLVASHSWNGRENERSQAVSEAFRDKNPSSAIGVNFTVPLNVPNWVRSIRGANQQIEAAHYELEQSRLSEAREWNDLSARLQDARARLKLTNTVESIQRDKFENERQRLQRGRTTTFQALTFEQDYAAAQLLRLRTQAEVLQVLAQMKSYRGNL